MDYAENNFSGNIIHPALITLLCIKGGIKASPLTLARFLKTLVEGKEVERIRKIRRINEQPRKIVPVVKAEEEFVNEEKGGGRGDFEDYTEQPVLFSNAEETIPALVRVEERGKRRAEVQENNNYEPLSLLTEMRDEMRIRDEHFREELRWRDNNQTEENKKREENLAALLQQRDEEWKEELAQRDKALRVELREREKSFVNDQLKRD